jgi:hypothetical protein
MDVELRVDKSEPDGELAVEVLGSRKKCVVR